MRARDRQWCCGWRRARPAPRRGEARGYRGRAPRRAPRSERGIAVEYTTASASGGTYSARLPDVHVDAGRRQAVEHRRALDVGAAHDVAHTGQHECDRAHAGPGHPDDVHAAGLGEVEHRVGGIRRHRRSSSTRSASRAAASGRPRPRADRSIRASRSGAARSSDTTASSRVGSHSASGTMTAAPARWSVCALRVWWSLGAPGNGTSTAGRPDRGELGDRPRAAATHRERRARRTPRPCAPRSPRARSAARHLPVGRRRAHSHTRRGARDRTRGARRGRCGRATGRSTRARHD